MTAIPIAISQHTLDFDGPDVGLPVKETRRKIQNFAGWFNTSSGLWAPTSNDFREDQSQPNDWVGTFEFKYQIT